MYMRAMRIPRLRRLLRWLFMIVLCLFVLLNLHILVNFQPGSTDNQQGLNFNDFENHIKREQPHVQRGDSGKRMLQNSEGNNRSQFIIEPNFFNGSDDRLTNSVDSENLTQIQIEIEKVNSAQRIQNIHRYGLKLNHESVVIVVQVHDRFEYLKILLDSLKETKKIEETLLIISHDVYSEPLNKLVKDIEFCPVLQIFFPHTLQLHPKSFPGEDPKDCPRNMKREEAVKVKCQNAAYPDKYGHYREAKYCQTKHHWFWKLNHIFERVNVMKNYEGLVLLLEEDYYVTPDILSVLQMMQNLRNKECKECKILAAGNYDKTQNFGANAGKVEVANWISSRHNMGMAFNIDLFKEIKRCGKEFCNFDDYNWDWTLQHLSTKCFSSPMKVLKMKATRVFHMGECGVHHKGKNCKPEEKKKTTQNLIDANKQHLFPNTVTIGGYSGLKLRDPKPNGGWGDLRDRQLCSSFITNSSLELH
ncbi:alpha-1,6-mannosyl-glycoprotein 2-beta-N-acetylglucosaminyltransferase-like isoform X2 [Mercenaria mercenaria]|uniref:alpha-1,6-mannosyl-glycoprotein 2-beta-N-acetylglucosaminyltransferase-like isoform X2 n=1 Tax=Mercenaria mercenaria TaxID=6596 RepID=UPI00234E7EFD|nr:alpha-1,6-mannosyl-glycoprotein 2-beta-N-acetylglucosaminyltransferase-like isoform X2 [Mercenaria mercenaria]